MSFSPSNQSSGLGNLFQPSPVRVDSIGRAVAAILAAETIELDLILHRKPTGVVDIWSAGAGSGAILRVPSDPSMNAFLGEEFGADSNGLFVAGFSSTKSPGGRSSYTYDGEVLSAPDPVASYSATPESITAFVNRVTSPGGILSMATDTGESFDLISLAEPDLAILVGLSQSQSEIVIWVASAEFSPLPGFSAEGMTRIVTLTPQSGQVWEA